MSKRRLPSLAARPPASSAMIELDHNQIEGKSPMADSTTKTVGVDLAKQVFAICETNLNGQAASKRA
jgi:hypothetical protein